MPYKRRYKRKRFRKRVSLAKKAYYMARGLKRNQELKFVEQTVTSDAVISDGIIFDIFNPSQGTTDQQRIGDKVIVKSLKMRYTFQQRIDDDTLCRIIIFYDKDNVIDSVDDILLPLPISAPGPQPLRQYNKDKRRNFTIIHDKTYTMSLAQRTLTWKKYFKRMSKWVQFNAGTQDVNKGQMKILLISNINDVSPNTPVFASTIRWKYVDN